MLGWLDIWLILLLRYCGILWEVRSLARQNWISLGSQKVACNLLNQFLAGKSSGWRTVWGRQFNNSTTLSLSQQTSRCRAANTIWCNSLPSLTCRCSSRRRARQEWLPRLPITGTILSWSATRESRYSSKKYTSLRWSSRGFSLSRASNTNKRLDLRSLTEHPVIYWSTPSCWLHPSSFSSWLPTHWTLPRCLEHLWRFLSTFARLRHPSPTWRKRLPLLSFQKIAGRVHRTHIVTSIHKHMLT